MKTIFIVNGPNFSHLHLREKEFYKGICLNELEDYIIKFVRKNYSQKVNIKFYQSNLEGEIIDYLLNNIENLDALIINPASYTHYSIAISDALKILKNNNKIICEVHLSNIFSREIERQKSITAKNADIFIAGAGIYSYILALEYIIEKLSI